MQGVSTVGQWKVGSSAPAFAPQDLVAAARAFREPVAVVRDPVSGRLGVARGGAFGAEVANGSGAWPLVGVLPAIWPEWLGDRAFCETHHLRFPYVTGAMANGIATPAIVIAMARAGMLGFLGSAGLTHARIAERLDEIEAALGGTGLPWGANLIHSPNEPELEMGTVELFLKRGVVRAEASAYMGLNPMIVRYAASGVRRGPDGTIHRKNFVFAKVSRAEVARRFMAPPPAEILDGLVARGQITAEEAALMRTLPVAEDVTVESDSGGHTDNRPLGSLFPDILLVRDEMVAKHGRPIRVGAAGGLGTPSSVASAFALGAAYVLTGSVNQGCVESGLSPYGRELLTKAGLADVVMAPAADMFELGVKVQVLKRGTMFGSRAQKLYDVYQAYPGMDAIPADERQRLEKEVFQAPLAAIWMETEDFFTQRDPREVERARREPKHQMALVFRWYLGLSSRWAIAGDDQRKMDFQIWCGPAQGAFNDWVKGSFLEPASGRTVVQVAANLLEGACVVTRAQQLRSMGLPVPAEAFHFAPRPLEV
ncbi:MAG: PfaD family polyunsaturated fatty acid/polyketide biosynthesis protein [Alphaproteobacteria bacterium]|nr:PfaD family polyunsaturated fatty acid/polyketide biosynthesis protein [Alphaproteobacteria bacterium]